MFNETTKKTVCGAAGIILAAHIIGWNHPGEPHIEPGTYPDYTGTRNSRAITTSGSIGVGSGSIITVSGSIFVTSTGSVS